MKDRVAIIDLDPLIHIVANVQYYAGNHGDMDAAVGHAKTFLTSVLANVESGKYIMFYQAPGHKNYRNDIFPEYKSHRTPSEGAVLFKGVICDLLERQGAHPLKFVESDDVLRAYALQCERRKIPYVVVENDKDLAMIPGQHYNPYKKQPKDKPPFERWFTFTKDQAIHNFWQQVISGDATDMPNEFCGMEGIGPAKAKKILGPLTDNEWMYPHKAMKAYVEKYGFPKGLKRMGLTYSMVYLLMDKNEHPEIEEMLYKSPRNFINSTEDLFNNEIPPDKTDSLI